MSDTGPKDPLVVFVKQPFASLVFLVSRDGCVALPGGAIGLSAVCDW